MVGAAYLIDAAVLRAHVSSGVTLCAKNLFGATSINTRAGARAAHGGFHHNSDGSDKLLPRSQIVWVIKTSARKPSFLLLMRFYGNDNMDGPPHRKWKMAPFNDAWPNSIFYVVI